MHHYQELARYCPARSSRRAGGVAGLRHVLTEAVRMLEVMKADLRPPPPTALQAPTSAHDNESGYTGKDCGRCDAPLAYETGLGEREPATMDPAVHSKGHRAVGGGVR